MIDLYIGSAESLKNWPQNTVCDQLLVRENFVIKLKVGSTGLLDDCIYPVNEMC